MVKSTINCLFSWDSKTLTEQILFNQDNTVSTSKSEVLFESVWKLFGIPPDLQSLRLNGKLIESPEQLLFDISNLECLTVREDDSQVIDGFSVVPHWRVSVATRLLGGKGGFGTLLRGQKGGRKKTKNFDACRDLSGRRLRHAKAMDRLTQWIEKRQGDDALVEALGGDPKVSPIHPPQNVQKKKMNDELNVLGGESQPMKTTYLEKVDETLDKTSMAVRKGLMQQDRSLRDPSLLDSGSSSSSSRRDSSSSSRDSKCNSSSSLKPSRGFHYMANVVGDYNNEKSSNDESSDDDEKQEIDQFDSLLQQISLGPAIRLSLSSNRAPIKPITTRARQVLQEEQIQLPKPKTRQSKKVLFNPSTQEPNTTELIREEEELNIDL